MKTLTRFLLGILTIIATVNATYASECTTGYYISGTAKYANEISQLRNKLDETVAPKTVNATLDTGANKHSVQCTQGQKLKDCLSDTVLSIFARTEFIATKCNEQNSDASRFFEYFGTSLEQAQLTNKTNSNTPKPATIQTISGRVVVSGVNNVPVPNADVMVWGKKKLCCNKKFQNRCHWQI